MVGSSGEGPTASHRHQLPPADSPGWGGAARGRARHRPLSQCLLRFVKPVQSVKHGGGGCGAVSRLSGRRGGCRGAASAAPLCTALSFAAEGKTSVPLPRTVPARDLNRRRTRRQTNVFTNVLGFSKSSELAKLDWKHLCTKRDLLQPSVTVHGCLP